MTKRRAPLSEHSAVRTVIELIGLDGAARAAGRHARTVGGWSENDRRGDMPFGAALRLDKAFIAAGGAFPPIGCAYMADLRVNTAAAFYNAMGRAELAARAAIEGGQASAACIHAYAGRNDREALLNAERETEEAIAAFCAQLHDIRRQLGAHGIERAW